tara:strand:+ start:616 stop:873 length:258 start_codon:yes stop_codon:yes gene_type:complete
VSILQRSVGDEESLKTAIFLFVNRGREAGLEMNDITDIFGISIARAGLTEGDGAIVLDWAEALDLLATAVHSNQEERKLWWKFWT